MRFIGDLARNDVFLTIDIYDLDNPVHPQGHVGWWRFPVEPLGERCSGRIKLGPDAIDITVNNAASEDRWLNQTAPLFKRAIVHAVLRTKSSEKIAAIDHIPLFAAVSDLMSFRARFDRNWAVPRYATPEAAIRPPNRTVRIVSQSVRLHDAVGNLCLDLYRMLRQNGIATGLYAEQCDLAINDICSPISRLLFEAGQHDTVIYFYSIFDRHLDDILALKVDRKIAYYHGITPPKLLQVFDPESAAACQKASSQLPKLVGFDVIAANSVASLQDISQSLADVGKSVEDVAIIPPCLTVGRMLPQLTQPTGSARARLLFVGRLKPNKRVEHVLALFAAYRALCPEAQCWIVGAPLNNAYQDYLHWVQDKQLALPQGAVHWLGQVSNEMLQSIYRSVSVFVCMSEHEGFCLPILEAMAAELPVMGFAQQAVEELLRGTGIMFCEKDYARLAEVLRTFLDTPHWVAEVVAHQRMRAAEVLRDADGAAFWRLLDRPPTAHRSSNASIEDAITTQLP